METKEILSFDDACELFSLSKSNLYKMIERDKELPLFRIGKLIRFDKDELIKYFKSKGR